MLKKTLLALTISAASMGAYAANVNVLTLGSDVDYTDETNYEQIFTFKSKNPILVGTPGTIEANKGTTGILNLALNCDVDSSFKASDFTLPEGMKITTLSTNKGGSDDRTDSASVAIAYTLENDIDAGSSFTVNLNGLTDMYADSTTPITSAVGDPAVISVSVTHGPADGTDDGNNGTTSGQAAFNLLNQDTATGGGPVKLVNFVSPYLLKLTPNSAGVILSEDSQGFSSTEQPNQASVGTISISINNQAEALQDLDGKSRVIDAGDNIEIKLSNVDITGLSALRVGDDTVTVNSSVATPYVFDLDTVQGNQELNVVYIADTDESTDIQSTSTPATVAAKIDQTDVSPTLDSSGNDITGSLSTIGSYTLDNDYRINAITTPNSSEKTIIRITNPTAGNVIVTLDMTNQDGSKLGNADLPNIAPYETVAYSSSDFAELVGVEAWSGRANAVISSTSQSLKVVPLLRSNGVLTNQAGVVQ